MLNKNYPGNESVRDTRVEKEKEKKTRSKFFVLQCRQFIRLSKRRF